MISADYYRNACFLTSAAQIAKGPPDEGIEVAFVGRSNSGKSSAINTLCAQKALARTSRTPGRTQLINFFSLDPQRKLVDLPGYGYAKVSVAIKGEWQKSLSEYLEVRNCLRGIILLMDVRHPLKDYDAQMLEWCQSRELPVHILLTKADKLNRGPAMAALQQLRSRIAAFPVPVSAQLFSALKRTGLDEAWAQLDLWFERSDAP